MAAVTLILKATRWCNLRCTYCHDWRAGKDQAMTFEVMARVIAAALHDPQHEAVHFIWHGGEPTMLPTAYYAKALLVQSVFRRRGQRVKNSIQTNATRLTPEWCQFFRQNDFSVGVSIDGPPEIHDRQRVHVSGRPTWDEVSRGIKTLQAYEVPHGVLMVVDAEALEAGPKRVFEFFVAQGIKKYGLIAAQPPNIPDAPPGTPARHYTDPGKMNKFLAGMFDCWLAHGDRQIRIRELESLRTQIAGESPGCCLFAGGCLTNYYMVEPNGDVSHCDEFVGDPAYTLGNVCSQRDFSSFRASRTMATLQEGNAQSLLSMQMCEEFQICNGWCPHERYVSRRHNLQHSDRCCGLRELIQHIRARMTDSAVQLSPQAMKPYHLTNFGASVESLSEMSRPAISGLHILSKYSGSTDG